MPERGQVVLVTGWRGFIGRQLVARLAPRLDPVRDRLLLLTREQHRDAARAEAEALGPHAELLEGDVTSIHLGLSGAEYKRATAQVTELWHLAGLYDLAADREAIRAVNVEGTRHVLELARAAR